MAAAAKKDKVPALIPHEDRAQVKAPTYTDVSIEARDSDDALTYIAAALVHPQKRWIVWFALGLIIALVLAELYRPLLVFFLVVAAVVGLHTAVLFPFLIVVGFLMVIEFVSPIEIRDGTNHRMLDTVFDYYKYVLVECFALLKPVIKAYYP